MRDRFGIFGAVIKIRKLSLLLVVTLRSPNSKSIFHEFRVDVIIAAHRCLYKTFILVYLLLVYCSNPRN